MTIDIGNSNIVVGLYSENAWQSVFRLTTSQAQKAPHYEEQLRTKLLEIGFSIDQIMAVAISSVVPGLTEVLAYCGERLSGKPPFVLSAVHYHCLPITIENTAEIGADLVANAVAAYQFIKGSALVVDFGTALTFTAIGPDGQLLGVAIAPGLKTAINALLVQTAQLPEVPLEAPTSPMGRNTVHAIQAGILIGYEEMVKGMIGRISSKMNPPPVVIATGGLHKKIPALASVFDHQLPTLTLDGLLACYQLSRG